MKPAYVFTLLYWGSLLYLRATQTELYVAAAGNDDWSGRLATPNADKTDGPFATLVRARDAIRELRQSGGLSPDGVEVVVRGGVYRAALELDREDSGTAAAPVVFRAYPGEEVRVSGGLAVTGFKPTTDPAILARLDESARGRVWQADLRALGLRDYGTPAGGGLELFFRDQPMPIARWPNLTNALGDAPSQGFVRIVAVRGRTPVDIRGTKGCVEGIFTYAGDRPRRWTEDHDIWLHGFWFWDWSDQRQPVKAIDPDQQTIELAPPYHGYGYRPGQWYYAYDLLSELDQPGEWYLDRATGILYFWPPAPLEGGEAEVSVLPHLLRMREVSFITLRGFIFQAARDTAVLMSGGTGNRIVGCTIRNVGNAAIIIDGGADHGVVGCDISQCGAGGVSLSGGDRRTLTPAGHFAENNHIHHYGRWRPMYSAAISLNGVGNRATHNLLDNAPHQAIAFGGNDHRLEFNEIHSVCFESNDAGAIYSGRDWTMRGTVIRYNYLHDITGFEGRGCVGVYLDDMYCGTAIVGNLFCRVTRAAFIGGGRDCQIENNIFIDCNPAIHVDARALGWARDHTDGWITEAKEKGTLSGTRYNQPPYSTRYPELVHLLSDDPAAPKGNVIAANICVGRRWDELESKARPLLDFHDNLLEPGPYFVDAARLNLRLRRDSPAPPFGFQLLPVDQMGLYPSPQRASWPVHHRVRSPASRR